MQAKLSTDAAALGDRRAKFSYVYSQLDKTAKKVAATYFQLGHDSKTADEFLTYLNEAYGDPQFQRNAILSVMKLRQRPSESFALFLNKFERLLADAGNENWSDLVKIINAPAHGFVRELFFSLIVSTQKVVLLLYRFCLRLLNPSPARRL